MRIKTLQNTTAEEVNSTVCHWRGWAQSRGHTGILGSVAGVPMPLYALPWDLWGSSRSTSPEGGSTKSMMMAAAVATCHVPSK